MQRDPNECRKFAVSVDCLWGVVEFEVVVKSSQKDSVVENNLELTYQEIYTYCDGVEVYAK